MSRILAFPVTMLVVALVLVGCAGTPHTPGSHRALLGPAGDRLLQELHGAPFDASRPTIRKLDPDLRDALEDAARDAREDGVTIVVTSGWRSRAHQERLFTDAISRYGGEEEARRYVATPDASAHVTGHAVDLGPTSADDWLSRHGADYGLCQVFANEIWHYELATTPGGTCPGMYPDSSYRG